MALLLAIAAVFATGCTGTWTGKGKEVAKALEQSGKSKTARFSASIQLSVSGVPGSNRGPMDLSISMSGKGDATDPANTKLEMVTSGEGVRSKMVQPGNGRTYMTLNGKTVDFPSQDRSEQETQSARVLTALGASVSGFRESQPMYNLEGESVPAVYATVDKDKLCSTVVGAFGEEVTKGSDTADWSKTLGGSGEEGLQELCSRVVKDDPGVWFGINDGMLTDLAMKANVALPMGAAMAMTVQYHEYDQDQDVGEFKTPVGSTATASPQEAQAILAQNR